MTTATNSPSATFTKVGNYEVLVGDKPVAFWPLLPEALETCTLLPPLMFAPNLPTTLNTAVVSMFGVIDIVVEMTDDAVTEQLSTYNLLECVSGVPTTKKMPLVRPKSGRVRICFAVDHTTLLSPALWVGTLRLTASYKVGNNTSTATLEVPLSQTREALVDNLPLEMLSRTKSSQLRRLRGPREAH